MSEAGPEKSRIAILNQSETQAHLYRLINEAERYIYLVSPYVHFDKLRTLVRHIQGALSKGLKVKLVVREKDSSSGKDDVLASASLPHLQKAGLEVFVLKDLHAKIYLSEKNAIITSLNLLETSFNNSIEIGAWLSAGTPEYEAVAEFLKKEIQPTAQKAVALPAPPAPAPPPKSAGLQPRRAKRAAARSDPDDELPESPDTGYCIRCGEEIEFNPDKPLCRDCYGVWSRYSDPNYQEAFCHTCGEEGETSVAKPLCYDCFKEQ